MWRIVIGLAAQILARRMDFVGDVTMFFFNAYGDMDFRVIFAPAI